jgi:5-oxoprolinase (ATP-hydrolysing)
VTTKGFKDILEIGGSYLKNETNSNSPGNQARPRIFDLEIKKPELLYEHVIEVDERVRIINERNTAEQPLIQDAPRGTIHSIH